MREPDGFGEVAPPQRQRRLMRTDPRHCRMIFADPDSVSILRFDQHAPGLGEALLPDAQQPEFAQHPCR
jgi:hypothetical protein